MRASSHAGNGAVMASVMAGYEGHRGWMNYLAVAPRFRGRGFGRADKFGDVVADFAAVIKGSSADHISLSIVA